MKRKPSVSTKKGNDQSVSTDLQNSVGSSVFPSEASQRSRSITRTTEMYEFESLLIKTLQSDPEDEEKLLRNSIYAFNNAFNDESKPVTNPNEILSQFDGLLEFIFKLAEFLSPKIEKVYNCIEKEEQLDEEGTVFLIDSLKVLCIIINFWSPSIRTITHSSLPKFILRTKLVYNRILCERERIESEEEEEDSGSTLTLDYDKIVGSLLRRLLSEDIFVKEMVLKNEAFSIFNAFIDYPTESLNELVNIAIKEAKDRGTGLLKYLSFKKFITLCCIKLKKILLTNNNEELSKPPVLWTLQLMNNLLEEANLSNTQLQEEFLNCGGYDMLATILVNPPFLDKFMELKNLVINILENLIFIGEEKSREEILVLANIDFPENEIFSPLNGPAIRNLNALTPLIYGLLYPKAKPNRFGLENIVLEQQQEEAKEGKEKDNSEGNEPPYEFKEKILMILNNLAKLNYTNYLLINKYHVMLELIENFSSLSLSMKNIVLNLLCHSVKRFGHIPLKELSVFPICLAESQFDIEAQVLLYDTISQLKGYLPKIQDIARNVGLLSYLCNYLSKILHIIKPYLTKDNNNNEDIMLLLTKEPKEIKELIGNNNNGDENYILLLMYPTICNNLVKLIENNSKNLTHLKQQLPDNFFDSLNFTLLRSGCLSIFCTYCNFYCQHLKEIENNEENIEKGQKLFEQIIEVLQLKNDNLQMKMEILSILIKVVDGNSSAQYCFTKAGGFVCLLSCLLMTKDIKGEEENENELKLNLKLAFIKLTSSVFLSTLANNQYSQWFIINEVGLNLFEEGFDLTGILDSPLTISSGFGILLGLIMGESSLFDAFDDKILQQNTFESQEKSRSFFGNIRCPCLIPSIFFFAPKLYELPQLEYLVLKSLWSILSSSIRNQIYFSQQPIIIKFLNWSDNLLSRKQENSIYLESIQLITSIIHIIFEFGSNDLKIESLLANLLNNQKHELKFQNIGSLEVILNEISSGIKPPILHFDSNIEKPSYLTLENFQRSLGTGNGYTLLLWFQIIQFPESNSLPLLRIYDNNNSNLNYELSLNENHFITCTGSNKVPVVFDTSPLRAEAWYHIALVQSKGLLSMSSNNIKLYINGKLSENRKHTFGFGTDLMNSNYTLIIGEKGEATELSGAVWNLSSLNLIDEVLDLQAIEIIFGLGIEYNNTFQDLNLLNKSLSDMDYYITKKKVINNNTMTIDTKATELSSTINNSHFNFSISEDKILTSLNPNNIIDFVYSDVFGNDNSKILASPTSSRFGILNLKYKYMNQIHNKNDGFGYLSKDLLFSPGINFSQEIWKLGGCSLLLKLIDNSKDVNSIEKAISIATQILCHKKQFSEEMSRIGGYEILGNLIKKKANYLSLLTIRALLSLVASKDGLFNQYMISNITAFRFLFLDFDIWRSASKEVQEAIIDSLKSFILHNANTKHNLKIMIQLDSVKRLIFLLRFEQFQTNLLAKIIELLKILLLANFTQDNVRLLVGFITSVLGKEFYIRPNSPRNLMSNNKNLFNGADIIEDVRQIEPKYKLQMIGNKVLEMFHDILKDEAYCVAISSMITSKWILLLYNNENNPYSIVLITRILSRLFYVNGNSFIQKFKYQHEGFAILNRILPKWWFLPQLYQALLSIIFCIDINDIPLNSSFDFFSLISLLELETKLNKEMILLDALLIFFTAIKNALCFCIQKTGDSYISKRSYRRPMTSLSTSFPEKINENSYLVNNNNNNIDSIEDKKELQERVDKTSKMVQTLMQFVTEVYHNSKSFRLLCAQKMISEILGETMVKFSERFSQGMNDSVDYFDYSLPDSILKLDNLNNNKSPLSSDDIKLKNKIGPIKMNKHRRALTMPENELSSKEEPEILIKNEAIETYIEFIMVISATSVIDPAKSHLLEIESFLKVAMHGTMKEYIRYANYLLSNIIRHLKNAIQLGPFILSDPKTLTGISKLSQLCVDFCYQGLFTSGRTLIFDFIVVILDKHQLQTVNYNDNNIKVFINTMLILLNKSILYCFKEATNNPPDLRFAVQFLKSFMVQHSLIFDSKNNDILFWKQLCYYLFLLLKYNNRNIKINTFNVWKFLVLMKKEEMSLIFKVKDTYSQSILESFLEVLEMDLESFSSWIESNMEHFEPTFNEVVKKGWEEIYIKEEIIIQEANKSFVERLNLRHQQFKLDKENEIRQYQLALSNLMSWYKNLQDLENDCYSRLLHDKADSNSLISTNWKKMIALSSYYKENDRSNSRWKLDLTEGPYRIRRRLKPNRHTFNTTSTTINKSKIRSMSISSIKASETFNSKNVESIKFRTYEEEIREKLDNNEIVLENEIDNESKVHRVLRYLEPNDEIVEVYNIGRVAGLDVADALLVFCRVKIYVIDGYFLCKDGNIVETSEIPEDERDVYLQLLTAASGKPLKDPKQSDHLCRKCAYTDLKEVHKRKFLFRDAAIEIFFEDGRNLLITSILNQRDLIYYKFTHKLAIPRYPHESVAGTPAEVETGSALGSKLSNIIFGSSSLTELSLRWCNREITNFEYLMHLNTLAGRSFNDLTQYPVFPWILSDYSSDELDLSNTGVFRDLSKPMGAQSDSRAREFKTRFVNFIDADDSTPPFHYGTHYSSAMIVCWYLIRLEPFTSHHLKIQGGNFDHPNRLFFSIKEAWLSAAFHNTTDVRELIPEFFYLPEFLINYNNYNFGKRQESGESIDNITLPPWAKNDPELFIRKHREALECDYVSENLHHWVDLIFGYKQQGPAAIEALNVFHHLSYEDAVDLDSINDPIEKAATIGIIHNFGQTPRQLFKKPHLQRNLKIEKYRFKLRKHPYHLIQSYSPILEVGNAVNDVIQANGKLMALGGNRIFIPRLGQRHIEWGLSDNSIRLFQTEPKKLLSVYEGCHSNIITIIEPFDETTIITGGDDGLVKIWNIQLIKNYPELNLKTIFRGAGSEIKVIKACKAFGIVVISSNENEITIWDMNRLKFIRKLNNANANIHTLAIDRSTGNIVACSDLAIIIWSINGELLAKLTLPSNSVKTTSILYIENKSGEYYINDLLITGHQKGIIKFWSLESKVNKNKQDINLIEEECNWQLTLLSSLNETSDISYHPLNDIVKISVSVSRQAIYTGNRQGSVYSWQFPDSTSELHRVRDIATMNHCCACQQGFNNNDKKVYCNPCGGLICQQCVRDSPFRNGEKSNLFLCQKCLERFDSNS
ncbi:hypothetical protein K502DRAFT_325660 [Neoconidiobolus thromboides FSU 785]|nr:hypothetical protein K502DRAFT_325660 [Neoconidiobolus thromboides FSU 785]